MVDTYTQGKLGLIEPARGSYVDTWDEPLYANWQTLEAAISGTTTLTLSNSNIVLTVPTYPTYADPPTVSTSAQNLRLLLTGTPSVNLTVYIPSTVSGFWIIDDQTTGSSTISIKTTAVGSTGVNSVRNNTLMVISDGTNVKYADSGIVNATFLVPSGSIFSFGGTSVPSGWLFCDGSAVSRTTYASLFATIGTSWGIGDGLTTFNIPDLQNMFLRGSGSSVVGIYEEDDNKSHTHTITITDPGHFHQEGSTGSTGAYGVGTNVTGPGYTYGQFAPALKTETKTTGITASAATSGSESRPKNKRVLYIIKT